MVKAAGNDGNNTHYNSDPLHPGYDMLTDRATAKNNLVIAAANDANVDSNGNLISVNIASFSSQGPTDDLRIKPDIAGNGAGLYSTHHNSDTAYNTLSGTSMATPNVSGSLLLLQEHYNYLNDSFMRAATLKGLALHTADDAGTTGPDARFGWGLLNVKRAAETISKNGSEALIQEMVLTQGQTITMTVDADGINDLIASISWTDRPSVVNDELNSPTPILVNDLDLRVSKNETTYYPWRLTSATSNDNGGDNKVDPFERIDVENASGTYTITISHKNILEGGSQTFSLIVSGVQVACMAVTPQDVQVNDITRSSASVSWVPAAAALYDVRYRESGTSTWITESDIIASHYEITELDLLTEYEVQVRSKCAEGSFSDYTASTNFTTTGEYCDSHSNNALLFFHISNVNLNTIDHNSAESTYSDFTAISTELIPGETYTVSVTPRALMAPGLNYAVWIDFNGNGVFDSSERVFEFFTTSDEVVSGDFTVPANVDVQSTTMRVTLSSSSTEQIPGPCDTFDLGEVEDYTITFSAPISGYVYENGVWTPEDLSGIATPSDDITVINGATSLTTNTDVRNLVIEAGATLEIPHILTLHGDITSNGDLIFLSSASGNGELAAVPATATVTGDVTVQRYMQHKRSYRMVSSSVTTTTSIHDNWQEGATSNTHNPAPGYGTHITGTTIDQQNGFDATVTGNPSMFKVDIPSQAFVAIDNTDVNTLTAGEPFLLFVRGDRSIDLSNNLSSGETVLRATGQLWLGDQSQAFSAPSANAFVMFGNPYQSAVDVNAVIGNSSNLNTFQYYVYDPSLGDHGAYVTVLLSDGTNTSGSTANQYLQPGQGAQIATVTSGTTLVNFTEADKRPGQHTTTSATGNMMVADGLLSGQLFTAENFTNGGPVHDSFGMLFAEGNSNALTLEDALKPMNLYENLGIDHDGTYLSLERRALPEGDEVFPLYTNGYSHTDYVLNMQLDGVEGVDLYLEDYFTGQRTLLEQGSVVYSFTIDASDPASTATDRFAISVGERLSIGDIDLFSGIALYPNPMNGDSFAIKAPGLNGKQVGVVISDLSGRIIYSETLNFNANTITVSPTKGLATGVYMVTMQHAGAARTFKLVRE